ncbi:MAG: hypothetical protein NTW90_09395 [Nitrosospira sp.]|nr:hypothetical protein [Nitrosospira sp.]
MASDLRAALPLLMPKAIAWAESQFSFIAEVGQPISGFLLAVAGSVGVLHPELIRIAEVPHLPLPEDPELRKAALAAGLLGPGMVGLTFGYGVYVCHGHKDVRLLSHEFRHVHQYEHAGSIASFLPIYLEQIATFGYNNAPLEVDARAHERRHA